MTSYLFLKYRTDRGRVMKFELVPTLITFIVMQIKHINKLIRKSPYLLRISSLLGIFSSENSETRLLLFSSWLKKLLVTAICITEAPTYGNHLINFLMVYHNCYRLLIVSFLYIHDYTALCRYMILLPGLRTSSN